MKNIIEVIYRGTTIYNGIECNVYEQIYNDGDIWYDLVPFENL